MNLSPEFLTEIFSAEKTDADRITFLEWISDKELCPDDVATLIHFLNQHAAHPNVCFPHAIDVCGTGGSGLDRINTSTLVAFVLHTSGVPISKHGNRAATGRMGSFDFLEKLGLQIEISAEHAQFLFWKTGLSFLFAPLFFPLMGQFKKARTDFGKVSVFNILGPLLSPGNPTQQFIGTGFPQFSDLLAKSAIALGREKVWIMTGSDGLDEITLAGETTVTVAEKFKIQNSKFKIYKISPEDFGLSPCTKEELYLPDIDERFKIATEILAGKNESIHRDLVAINAAFILTELGKISDYRTAYKTVCEKLKNGEVFRAFQKYKTLHNDENILTKIVGSKCMETGKSEFVKLKNKEPSIQNFYHTLVCPGLSVIAEVKKASPSRGELISDADFDPIKIAENYQKNGAAAISVLTDKKFFCGNFSYLSSISRSIKLPTLCKDFIIHESQIYKAQKNGASSFLLMKSILSAQQIEYFLRLGRSLGLEALVETHDTEELKVVLDKTSAKIIGINHRDLRDFSVDIGRSFSLIEEVKNHPRFDEIVWVAESGIHGPEDIKKLHPCFSAVLVGEGVVKNPKKISALMAARPAVKICGVTSVEIAKKCAELGVDIVGLNFVPASPRFIDKKTAKKIITSVRKNPQTKRYLGFVGIFQNHSIDEIVQTVQSVGLDGVQLSGQESAEFIQELKNAIHKNQMEKSPLTRGMGVFIIKGVSISEKSDIKGAKSFLPIVDRVLLESKNPGKGEVISAEILSEVDFPCWLSGGLNSENVGKFRGKFIGFDTASGVEIGGKKDAERIRIFYESVKF